jgi:hypothetical protein
MRPKTKLFPVSIISKAPRQYMGSFWESTPFEWRDVQFLRSWLEYDSEFDLRLSGQRINWNALLGLALVSVVSLTCWAGMAVTLNHLLK